MKQSVLLQYPSGTLLALVGNPNCGKTALFNRLTGSRQKVANYAGVTVERKEGRLITPSGKTIRVLDLPGTYSLYPRSPDEQVTCEVLTGDAAGEKRPDLVVCVVDATNLRRNLHLVLAVKRLGLPMIVTLNMSDLAEKRGIKLQPSALAAELGVPVVSTIATKAHGIQQLQALLDQAEIWQKTSVVAEHPQDHTADYVAVQHILQRLGLDQILPHTASDRIDRVVLHPIFGPIFLTLVLFLLFQAVFSWAEAPMAWIKDGAVHLSEFVGTMLSDGWLKSLIVDAVIAGAGSVLVFLPQIIILYLFILILEESGYLPRAAFLLDRIMGGVGLSGRSFIPLLSCFACAIPGIMASRSIANTRDRFVTIMIAPLMTCSARLPVYALLIGAFIPARNIVGMNLQGLVMLGLYVAGIIGAMLIAWLLKHFTVAGQQVRPLMMELPSYHWPIPFNILLGIWQRVKIFVIRVGSTIVMLTIALWLLASFPAAPAGAVGSAIEYSYAGMIGKALMYLFEPIGFNWQISVALIPGMAAREVIVGALGTVYSLSSSTADTAVMSSLISQQWSLPTALSLLAWVVFAPQCIATLAAAKRETGGWKIPIIMLAYLFGLAYFAAYVTYHVAVSLGIK